MSLVFIYELDSCRPKLWVFQVSKSLSVHALTFLSSLSPVADFLELPLALFTLVQAINKYFNNLFMSQLNNFFMC